VFVFGVDLSGFEEKERWK